MGKFPHGELNDACQRSHEKLMDIMRGIGYLLHHGNFYLTYRWTRDHFCCLANITLADICFQEELYIYTYNVVIDNLQTSVLCLISLATHSLLPFE